jgi:hypothetical protein
MLFVPEVTIRRSPTGRFVVRPPAENVAMARQLTLIPASTQWKLDEKTKQVGRRGLAEARAALAAHRPAESARRSAA